jgi:linoleoyl-CoA desaturase
MAWTDVKQVAHLTEADIDAIEKELDAVRKEIEESRGDSDAEYIRRLISIQRKLAVAGRLSLMAGALPPFWLAGTLMLATHKILENMEIGHNVMHGQWDWMNDPEIHSSTWEWDTACPAEQWKHSHNVVHHTYTNVIGKDKDVGYEILRVRAEQPWHPATLGQPVYNFLLAMLFQWGVALHDLDLDGVRSGATDPEEMKAKLGGIWRKVRRQVVKDYVVFPALAGPFAPFVFTGNATANWLRNMWSYGIIFCGHFPDGAEMFTEDELEGETKGQWYVRQLLGAANFTGSKLFHILSGNLGYQIEHHLFPDLPSNRYADIAVKVQDLCERYDLPYTTGPWHRQYGQVLRTILRLSLPGGPARGPEKGPVRPRRAKTEPAVNPKTGPKPSEKAA